MKRKIGFYIYLSVVLFFIIAGLFYVSMFVIFYNNDIDADFVIFTIENYCISYLIIALLPLVLMIVLFVLPLCFDSSYLGFDDECEGGILIFSIIGYVIYLGIISGLFSYTIERDNLTDRQRNIIIDLVKQEKISKQSVRARFYNDWVKKEGGGREIGKVMDINRVPLEFYVCFEKGFNSPICAKLFENFLIKEKEEVRREKAREYLAKKNKIESIENYNRIIEKVK